MQKEKKIHVKEGETKSRFKHPSPCQTWGHNSVTLGVKMHILSLKDCRFLKNPNGKVQNSNSQKYVYSTWREVIAVTNRELRKQQIYDNLRKR